MGLAEWFVIVASVAVAGFLWWFFFGPKKSSTAAVRDGVQVVDITVKGGYVRILPRPARRSAPAQLRSPGVG